MLEVIPALIDRIDTSSLIGERNKATLFNRFFERHTLKFISQQIELMEKILQVSRGSLLAAIEQQLTAGGWTMEQERVRIKDNWDGHVHPQGWPVVWITTEFQELAMETLWEILDDVASKFRLNNQEIERLWQIVQMADPAYVFRGVSARPEDIKLINVHDKKEWLTELDKVKPLQIAESICEPENVWITVYERRSMAMEELYNVPYRQFLRVQAYLIPQRVYGRIEALEELELFTERIMPNFAAVTMKQAEAELKQRRKRFIQLSDELLPLIAIHHNPPSLFGYPVICSLTSYILEDFNLTFEGLNLIQDGNLVARFESWQEGYQDEVYSRDKLAYGVRLRIHRDLLNQICSRYRKVLCIKEDEEREYYKSLYKREPDESNNSSRYILYHL